MIGLTDEWIDAAARSPDRLTGEEMEIVERIEEKSGLNEIENLKSHSPLSSFIFFPALMTRIIKNELDHKMKRETMEKL